MKNHTFLPLGSLLILLCPNVYGQHTYDDSSGDVLSVANQHHTTAVAQHDLGVSGIETFNWVENTTSLDDYSDGSELSFELNKKRHMRPTGVSGYATSLGLRGGYTSGISLKHFIKSNAALEFVLGTRWEGYSFTALYEWHTNNAFNAQQLTWVYGLGARIGNYRGDRFYNSRNCNDPNDKRCGNYWGDRSLTAVGLVGIAGLEFVFDEIPISLSLDIMPVIYLNYWGGTFFDGSASIRYILK